MSRHSLPRNSSPRHVLAMVVALSMTGAVLAGPPIALADSSSKHSAESLARRALAADKEESTNAVAELRSIGPEG